MVWYFLFRVWGGQTLKSDWQIPGETHFFWKTLPLDFYCWWAVPTIYLRDSEKQQNGGRRFLVPKWIPEQKNVSPLVRVFTLCALLHIWLLLRGIGLHHCPVMCERWTTRGSPRTHTFSPCSSLPLLLMGTEHFPAHSARLHASC